MMDFVNALAVVKSGGTARRPHWPDDVSIMWATTVLLDDLMVPPVGDTTVKQCVTWRGGPHHFDEWEPCREIGNDDVKATDWTAENKPDRPVEQEAAA